MNTRTTTLGLLLAILAACAPVDDAPGGAALAITNGNPASEFQRQRAAFVVGSGRTCTATIVGQRHLLTAAHCRFSPGAAALFYNGSSAAVDASLARSVSTVAVAPGVSAAVGDLTETDGDFADYAVLTLSADIPATSRIASMALSYPGYGAEGARVGAGSHDGENNPARALETNSDTTITESDARGDFFTFANEANPGDSGGAFYHLGALLGVLYGADVTVNPRPVPLPWFGNRYASVRDHLPTILRLMNYRGPFATFPGGGIPSSVERSLLTSSELVCRYACEQSNTCRGYSWVPSFPAPHATCFLRNTTTGTVAQMPGALSGTKLL